MVSRRVSTNRLGPFAGSPGGAVCDATGRSGCGSVRDHECVGGALDRGGGFGVGGGQGAGRDGEDAEEKRAVVDPVDEGDAAGREACGERPVAGHRGGDGQLDERAVVLGVVELVGSIFE